MKRQGSLQGKPSLHLQVQWLHTCKWLKLQGEKGHAKLETYKRAINCYACSANGQEKFRGRGTTPLPTSNPLPTCVQAHHNTAHLPKRILGASVGEGSVGKVREKGVCTLTLHTHLACPPACSTRAPRMSQPHRRKKQGLSAMIGGAGWGRGVRAGWGRRECAHPPCTLTLLALPPVPRTLPGCANHIGARSKVKAP